MSTFHIETLGQKYAVTDTNVILAARMTEGRITAIPQNRVWRDRINGFLLTRLYLGLETERKQAQYWATTPAELEFAEKLLIPSGKLRALKKGKRITFRYSLKDYLYLLGYHTDMI